MSYRNWVDEHAKKHAKILQKLAILCYLKEQIIEYFNYENMRLCEPEFCLLYSENKKCHEMDDLNCYFCACTHFRFTDTGMPQDNGCIVYSTCSIKSKDGKQENFNGKIHQDCSNCTTPHKKEYIQNTFDISWSNAMSECEIPSIQI